ncbi:MAG: methionine--tRNA ligase [bacterium]|nr:methionine--tRNA ligase [bacterium]
MKKFYVTNSIAYINAEPHIGYGQEILATDVVARYHRDVLKDDTFFLTGADEHGFSVQMNAVKAKMEPKKFVDKLIEKYLDLKVQLNLTYDYFIRTTSEEHKKNAREIWSKALENGYIYKKFYSGVYCVGCEMMKNKSELVNERCPNHPNLIPEIVEEENWFFKLAAFQEKLEKLYKDNPTFVQPDFRFNEVKSLLKSGLEDVSISRPKEKLNWGIEVPNDPMHVMYVWFDALTNYLYPKKYWPADLHIIGKDILRFHAALWPAMLMAAGYENDQLPKKIYVHGFISVDGQKMSKTLGNVVKASDMIERYGKEATRYLLLKELSFDKDGDFSWERMTQTYNADLANDLGNLLQRTLTMINKYRVNIKPKGDYEDIELVGIVNMAIEEMDFVLALTKINAIVQWLNKLIENNKPWDLAEKNPKKCAEILNIIHNYMRVISKCLIPFMPETSKEINRQLESLEPKPLFLRIGGKG